MTDENERRFTIDNSIKRYDSAVRHLCRCRPVRTEQILSFAKLQRVYTPVVEELSVASDGEGKEALQSAAVLLAESLTARENHEEAGYLFQRVGLYQRALDSFKLCGLWNNCLAMASVLKMRFDLIVIFDFTYFFVTILIIWQSRRCKCLSL